jgi:hypothetical protein
MDLRKRNRTTSSSIVPGARSGDYSGARTSRFLLVAAVLVFFLLFLRYYAKAPREASVIQVRVGKFHPDMLMDKHPILIEDRVLDVNQLMRTTLRYYYLFGRHRKNVKIVAIEDVRRDKLSNGQIQTTNLITTYASATFVSPVRKKHNTDTRYMLRASNKRVKDSPPIDFRLHASQVIVLPPNWTISVPPEFPPVQVSIAEAYDILHVCMFPLAYSGALTRRKGYV